jgi:hypothetical protein
MDHKDLTDMRQRYAAFFGEESLRDDAITELESSLGVILPDDVKAIAVFFRGDLLGGISHYSFDGSSPATNVVERTLSFRSAVDLPHRFLVLAEPAESVIVFDVESGVVTWCDNFDVSRLDDTSKMLGKPNTWLSYADFFRFLLDEEAEERSE